jgi:hypothetical protein
MGDFATGSLALKPDSSTNPIRPGVFSTRCCHRLRGLESSKSTECVRERRLIYIEHAFIQPNGRGVYRLSKALYTPLSENGIAVSQVLVFHVLVAPASPQLGLDLWAQPYRSIVHAPH